MKNLFKKTGKLFLTLLVLLNSAFQITPVFAEENDPIDYSEAVETITELGIAEEVFPELFMEETANPKLRMTPGFGSEPIVRINGVGVYGYDYIRILTVGGNVVFCIEPWALFATDHDYPVNTIKWNDLSEYQRQAIWELNYYGYSYPGHQTERYYAATQLLIWEVVDRWYDPYYPDGVTPIDLSPEINEINYLRSQPQGRPSFNNQTVKMGINTPVTLTDTKGTLGNYNVNSGNGINASVSGNNLTVSITSENYDRTLTFSRKNSARDVHVIYGAGGDQKVIFMASRSDPTPNFKLNFELLYADIEVEKQDIETGTKAQGDATFNGAVFEVKDASGNVLETITTDGAKAKSKKYPVGTTLNVCEVTPPEGYLLNSSCSSVELKFSGDSTPSTFYTTCKDQVIKGRIEIAKTIERERKNPYESVISEPGVGFVFDIILKSSGETVATLTTDEDGRAITDWLPYGTYVVKEHAVTGYDTLKPFEVKIEQDQKTYFYNIYNDTLKAELNIYKTDAETGKRIPAAGVEFKIKDENGNFIKQTVTYPNKYETDVFVTNEEGSVHLPETLKFGKYWIVEIKAPYGYVLSDKEIPVNVDGTATEIFMNFDNTTQKGQVYVEKYGEMLADVETSETKYGTLYTPIYEEKYLEGVTYQITAREDIITPEGTLWYSAGDVVDTFTTVDGVTTSSLLQLGKYSITEINTPEGFVLDPTVYDFDIEYGGQLIDVVEIKQSYKNDRQKLDLEITKTFEDEDPDAYKDVVFGVYAKDEIVIREPVEEVIPVLLSYDEDDDSGRVCIPADGLVGILTLDENGHNVEQLDLPVGDYYIRELETNVGFVLDEENHEFTFEYGETSLESIQVGMVLHNEKRRLDLEVNKVDSEHKDHFLNGAIFEVYDKTTGKYVASLCSGNLMIKGSEKDEEYEIAKDEAFEEIIKTAKTDENKEIIIDLDDGIYYSRKADSEEVTKHIVKDGKAVLADAIYGHEYEFKEIKAPVSYKLADKSKAYKVEADRDSDIVIVYFENDRIIVPNTGV